MEMIVTNPKGLKVIVKYGSVEIMTDQPVSAGGGGGLPTPFDLFLASIPACGAFFAYAFCQARGIPTEGIRLLARTIDSGGMISGIEMNLELPRDFPAKYRDAVVKAAEACKVLKHLVSPPVVSVKAVDAGLAGV